MQSKPFSIHRVASNPFDYFSSICCFKTKLYTLTNSGFVMIMNTVQNKVIFRQTIPGLLGNTAGALICRHRDEVMIVQPLRVPEDQPEKDGYMLHLYSKHFAALRTKLVLKDTTEDLRRRQDQAPRTVPAVVALTSLQECTKASLYLVAFHKCSRPLAIYATNTQGIQEIGTAGLAGIQDAQIGLIRDVKVAFSHIYLALGNKKLLRIQYSAS